MKSRPGNSRSFRKPSSKPLAARGPLTLALAALSALLLTGLPALRRAELFRRVRAQEGITPPSAGILYLVNSTGDGDLCPNCPSTTCDDGTGHCTLRAAIEASNLHSGTDGISINIDTTLSTNNCDTTGKCIINLFSALPNISDSVSITGPGAAKLTVQPTGTNGQYRVFNVTTTGTVKFSGLTITGGVAPSNGDGGGIQNVNTGTINVTNCTITKNSTGGGGGGIATGSGTVTVANSTISGNSAGVGGGIGVAVGVGAGGSAGGANVSNSTIYGNTASQGGGITIEPGVAFTVTSSTISGNSASGACCGGQAGGGIANAGALTVTNSTISGNSAPSGEGGGILNDGTASIADSTISGNNASTGGGGIDTRFGTANVKSSIIALNAAGSSPDGLGAFSSAGFNLIGKTDGTTGFPASTDQTGTIASPLDPKLETDGNGKPLLKNNGGPIAGAGTLAFSSSAFSVNEGCFEAMVTVNRTNGSTGTVSVDFATTNSAGFTPCSTTNGTAAQNCDFAVCHRHALVSHRRHQQDLLRANQQRRLRRRTRDD